VLCFFASRDAAAHPFHSFKAQLNRLAVFACVVQIMQCVSDTFGRRIWQKTLLVLTHGNLPMPPPGTSFGE
jgi:hypothetical protein